MGLTIEARQSVFEDFQTFFARKRYRHIRASSRRIFVEIKLNPCPFFQAIISLDRTIEERAPVTRADGVPEFSFVSSYAAFCEVAGAHALIIAQQQHLTQCGAKLSSFFDSCGSDFT